MRYLPRLRFVLLHNMFITMLFNPLRQIADKFNEMQLGMIAANRVLRLLIRKINTRYRKN
jgi:ABC-type multidrug transport system fused ATPase/permease subunit